MRRSRTASRGVSAAPAACAPGCRVRGGAAGGVPRPREGPSVQKGARHKGTGPYHARPNRKKAEVPAFLLDKADSKSAPE